MSIHFLQRQVFYVYQHWNSWCNKEPPKPLRDHWQWYLQHPETQRCRSWPRKAPRLPGSFDPKIGSFDPYFSYFLHHLPTFWCRPPRILPRFWCQHLGHPTSRDLVTFCEVQYKCQTSKWKVTTLQNHLTLEKECPGVAVLVVRSFSAFTGIRFALWIPGSASFGFALSPPSVSDFGLLVENSRPRNLNMPQRPGGANG